MKYFKIFQVWNEFRDFSDRDLATFSFPVVAQIPRAMRTFACFQAHALLQRTVGPQTIFPASRCASRATMLSTAAKYALLWIPLLLCALLAVWPGSKHGRAVRSIW